MSSLQAANTQRKKVVWWWGGGRGKWVVNIFCVHSQHPQMDQRKTLPSPWVLGSEALDMAQLVSNIIHLLQTSLGPYVVIT